MTIHRTTLHRRARPACESDPTRAIPRSGPQVDRSRPTLTARLLARLSSTRGDVPGWVLITLMTAGIVVALWAVASEQIVQIFQNAMAPFLDGSM
ncbi:hypothetical protein ACFQS2_04315 [Brachybacterium sp. GCM10030267]|uniref:hypothetical protein n=1 Tax=unclassified Brachybacterium TaxID=2623841 RepID=UPI00361EAD03